MLNDVVERQKSLIASWFSHILVILWSKNDGRQIMQIYEEKENTK